LLIFRLDRMWWRHHAYRKAQTLWRRINDVMTSLRACEAIQKKQPSLDCFVVPPRNDDMHLPLFYL